MRVAPLFTALMLALPITTMVAAQIDEKSLNEFLDEASGRTRVGVEGDTARIEMARGDGRRESLQIVADAGASSMRIAERGPAQGRGGSSLEIRATSLVEYLDTNGDGAPTEGDEIVKRVRLSGLRDAGSVIREFADGSGHSILMQAMLPKTAAMLSTVLEVRGGYAEENPQSLALTGFAVGFNLDHYTPTDPRASVAILTSVSQRGTVAGLTPTDDFPWPNATDGGSIVIEEGRRNSDTRRSEVAAIPIKEGTGALAATDEEPEESTETPDEDEDAGETTKDNDEEGESDESSSALARCALRFECA